MPKVGDIDM